MRTVTAIFVSVLLLAQGLSRCSCAAVTSAKLNKGIQSNSTEKNVAPSSSHNITVPAKTANITFVMVANISSPATKTQAKIKTTAVISSLSSKPEANATSTVQLVAKAKVGPVSSTSKENSSETVVKSTKASGLVNSTSRTAYNTKIDTGILSTNKTVNLQDTEKNITSGAKSKERAKLTSVKPQTNAFSISSKNVTPVITKLNISTNATQDLKSKAESLRSSGSTQKAQQVETKVTLSNKLGKSRDNTLQKDTSKRENVTSGSFAIAANIHNNLVKPVPKAKVGPLSPSMSKEDSSFKSTEKYKSQSGGTEKLTANQKSVKKLNENLATGNNKSADETNSKETVKPSALSPNKETTAKPNEVKHSVTQNLQKQLDSTSNSNATRTTISTLPKVTSDQVSNVSLKAIQTSTATKKDKNSTKNAVNISTTSTSKATTKGSTTTKKILVPKAKIGPLPSSKLSAELTTPATRPLNVTSPVATSAAPAGKESTSSLSATVDSKSNTYKSSLEAINSSTKIPDGTKRNLVQLTTNPTNVPTSSAHNSTKVAANDSTTHKHESASKSSDVKSGSKKTELKEIKTGTKEKNTKG